MTMYKWIRATFVAMLVALLSLPAAFAAPDPQEATETVALLDINSADAATIAEALDGVGLVKAQEIVAYREMFGNFESVDELVEVQGIGMATVEKNRHRIVIGKK